MTGTGPLPRPNFAAPLIQYGVYGRMADVYEALGEYAKAKDLFDKAEAAAGERRVNASGPARYSPRQVRLLALQGRRADALAPRNDCWRSRNLNSAAGPWPPSMALWEIRTARLRWLNKAIDQRSLVVSRRPNPSLTTNLRDDPRWAATLRRINLIP